VPPAEPAEFERVLDETLCALNADYRAELIVEDPQHHREVLAQPARRERRIHVLGGIATREHQRPGALDPGGDERARRGHRAGDQSHAPVGGLGRPARRLGRRGEEGHRHARALEAVEHGEGQRTQPAMTTGADVF
jgi:hypothetical protein